MEKDWLLMELTFQPTFLKTVGSIQKVEIGDQSISYTLKKDEKKEGDGESRPNTPGKEKTVVKSTTDPESGSFHKGEHRKCFAYEAHTVCDRRRYVLETEITPGNVHDSVAFDTVFERLRIHYPEFQVITADAGYKTPWICKQIFDSGRIPVSYTHLTLPTKA